MNPDLATYVEHFRARVLQDTLAEALPAYWLRRAKTFAAVGNARCDEIATACRNQAQFLTTYPLLGVEEFSEPEIVAAIREAA
jgi:hypothetical protein